MPRRKSAPARPVLYVPAPPKLKTPLLLASNGL
jgi:hypothetical protein